MTRSSADEAEDAVSPEVEEADRRRSELSQLMRIQKRLFSQLQEVRDELATPATSDILRELRRHVGPAPEETFGKVTAAVEEAIRALKVFESEVKRRLFDDPDDLSVEGIPDLPAHLARFLAEKSQVEGFTYDVRQDPVRGWIIRWKEYTSRGTVRGYGQIYERPHAWLDE